MSSSGGGISNCIFRLRLNSPTVFPIGRPLVSLLCAQGFSLASCFDLSHAGRQLKHMFMYATTPNEHKLAEQKTNVKDKKRESSDKFYESYSNIFNH